uniref:Uncharacterized protein n=1 Tax=Candidatus Kentrum eta TaxID=2126337 RepID=A0A450VN43_9GAMM|nr:MAG: hypothetical protein BECKH772B_GA0070898_101854 [Candidatus Kentron sp. H]VFK03596.1 MAG: hypothetical protein BECKH772A_GA0070896_103383 [Candidatus Kentron sp. H]VFK06140.1 MAG: hypothetical protein BECKH772C_GA0070978_103282 [Candidatus Kentron sp. H]
MTVIDIKSRRAVQENYEKSDLNSTNAGLRCRNTPLTTYAKTKPNRFTLRQSSPQITVLPSISI